MSSEGDIQQSIHKALQANKDHQYALRIYSERIDAELESLNKLLASADVSDTEEDTLEVNSGGWVIIPDATDVTAPVSPMDLFHHASPFRDAALRRQRYVDVTVMHQWKPNDLEALSDAVKSENHRLYAVEAQLRGQQGLPRQTEDLTKFMEENTTGIDWERVRVKASKSSLSGDYRSAKACEIKWLGERHPRFNHSQWTQPEIDRVKELISGSGPGQINWVHVAEKLGTGRTPLDCMRHAVYRRLHVWDADSDNRLRNVVETYGTDNWTLAARLVSQDATPQQCQNRWTRYLDPHIVHEPFTEEEDRLLRDAVAVYGNAWHEIALFFSGRTNEQCRERAQDLYAFANVKKKWTEDEDRAILETAEDVDAVDFAEVARGLGTGRSEAQVRNRYSALMRRINRMPTQSLRPILPAPPLQPVAGPSKLPPKPVVRPPGTYRPILPATGDPPEVGQIAYPGNLPQAQILPLTAPGTQTLVPQPLVPPSLQMIDPALRPLQNAGGVQAAPGPAMPQLSETGVQSSSQALPIEASTSQPQAADPTSSGGQQSRPRPRPRRKRVEECNPEPADVPPSPASPPDGQGLDAEAAAPTARKKGKGKATETAREADEPEENTLSRVRKPTKRARNTTTDRPALKRKPTKNKVVARVDAGDQTDLAEATNEMGDVHAVPSGHTRQPGDPERVSPTNASSCSQRPDSLEPLLVDGISNSAKTDAADIVAASAEARVAPAASTSGGSKRGRRPGPRSQSAMQPPTRRSTRLQNSKAAPSDAPAIADAHSSVCT